MIRRHFLVSAVPAVIAVLAIFVVLIDVAPAYSSDNYAYRIEQFSGFTGPMIITMKPGRFKCVDVKQSMELIAIEPNTRVQLVNRKTKKVAWDDLDTWARCGAPVIAPRSVELLKATRPLCEVKVAGTDCLVSGKAAFLRDVHLSEYMQKVSLGVYRLGIDSRLLPVAIVGGRGEKRKRLDTSKIEVLKPANVQIEFEKGYKEAPLMSLVKLDDNVHMAIDILDSMAPSREKKQTGNTKPSSTLK